MTKHPKKARGPGQKRRRKAKSPPADITNRPVKVRVGAVMPKGKHRVPYLVTWPVNSKLAGQGSITIPNTTEALEGEPLCKGGEILVAFGVGLRDKGWCAEKARRFRMEDLDNPEIQ